jgi:hypothetical protein
MADLVFEYDPKDGPPKPPPTSDAERLAKLREHPGFADVLWHAESGRDARRSCAVSHPHDRDAHERTAAAYELLLELLRGSP